MPQNARPLYPAFSPGDNTPLAESILPLPNGLAVMSQIYPEGVATFRGMVDQDGQFTAVCGSFRSFRPQSLYRDKASRP